MTDRTKVIELLQKAVAYQREQFDADDDAPAEVNGGDMVEWFTEFRNEAHSLLRSLEYAQQRDKEADEKHAALMDIGKNAMSSLAEMVAALNCDYDRLEELRDAAKELPEGYELDAVVGGVIWKSASEGSDRFDTDAEATRAAWMHANPDEAEELKELEDAAGECKDRDEAYERIQEDPLSIEVRSGWVTPPIEAGTEPEEFVILLATGGPAVRIIGEFGTMNSPENPRLQVQDWFTPWTEYLDADRDVLQTYCEQFYFGD